MGLDPVADYGGRKQDGQKYICTNTSASTLIHEPKAQDGLEKFRTRPQKILCNRQHMTV